MSEWFSVAGVTRNTILDKFEFFFASTNSTAQEEEGKGKVKDKDKGEDSKKTSASKTKQIIDTSEEQRGRERGDSSASAASNVSVASVASNVSSASDANSETEIIPTSSGETEIASKGKKKKANKHKKKKPTNPNAAVVTPRKGNRISWGNVEQVFFLSELGYSAVPNRGAHPLGLGEEDERITCTIDELFVQQQMVLLDRARTMNLPIPSTGGGGGGGGGGEHPPIPSSPGNSKTNSPIVTKKKQHSQNSPARPTAHFKTVITDDSKTVNLDSKIVTSDSTTDESVSSSPYMPLLFETRQFDYKPGYNPMYRPVPEDKRILRLMANKAEWSKLTDTSKPFAPHAKQHHHHHNNNHSTNTNSSTNSTTNNSTNGTNGSTSSSATSTAAAGSESPKHLGDLNKDIKDIQSSRDHSAEGCSCKPVKVDKLSVSKMKHELVALGKYAMADIDKWSKTELTTAMKEAVKECVMCITNNCSCVQLGIACSVMANCGCLRSVAGDMRRRSRGDSMDCTHTSTSTSTSNGRSRSNSISTAPSTATATVAATIAIIPTTGSASGSASASASGSASGSASASGSVSAGGKSPVDRVVMCEESIQAIQVSIPCVNIFGYELGYDADAVDSYRKRIIQERALENIAGK